MVLVGGCDRGVGGDHRLARRGHRAAAVLVQDAALGGLPGLLVMASAPSGSRSRRTSTTLPRSRPGSASAITATSAAAADHGADPRRHRPAARRTAAAAAGCSGDGYDAAGSVTSSRCGRWAASRPSSPASPVGRPVVLEELAPDVRAGVEAVDDRVDDAGRAVDDVERRVEAVLGRLALGDVRPGPRR